MHVNCRCGLSNQKVLAHGEYYSHRPVRSSHCLPEGLIDVYRGYGDPVQIIDMNVLNRQIKNRLQR